MKETEKITLADAWADHELIAVLKRDISEEIFKALRIPRIEVLRNTITHNLSQPIGNFCTFIARIDALVKQYGVRRAAEVAVEHLSQGVNSVGDVDIPADGPLLIASNHPGTYDALSILSRLPRDDTKVVISGIPFFRNLPNAAKHFIFTSINIPDRMNVIRKAVRHLQEGGSLLIFPSGRIDPDPSIFPDAETQFSHWSRSVEVFLKKAPQTRLVLSIASGVLSRDFVNHPLARLFKKGSHERLRVMEFMQVIRQMARGLPVELNPKISFAEPIRAESLLSADISFPDQVIKEKAKWLLNEHISHFYI
jgi:1-acyl-sn-glycerol-3-phosphate acyltransferase